MKFTNKQIIKAMRGTAGIYWHIQYNLKNLTNLDKSKSSGMVRLEDMQKDDEPVISRQALHERINNNPELKAVFLEERESIDDLGESALINAIQKKEPYAVTLWTKYRGRARGYAPAAELDKDDKPVQPVAVISLDPLKPVDNLVDKPKLPDNETVDKPEESGND